MGKILKNQRNVYIIFKLVFEPNIGLKLKENKEIRINHRIKNEKENYTEINLSNFNIFGNENKIKNQKILNSSNVILENKNSESNYRKIY